MELSLATLNINLGQDVRQMADFYRAADSSLFDLTAEIALKGDALMKARTFEETEIALVDVFFLLRKVPLHRLSETIRSDHNGLWRKLDFHAGQVHGVLHP